MNAMSSNARLAENRFPSEIPTRMFAAVLREYGDPTRLELEEVDVPTVPAGAVLVRVRAAGLHKGTVHLMSGTPYLVRAMGFGLMRPKQPIPGDELAGVVVSVGEGVSGYEVGDRVFGITTGALAQYAVVDPSMLAPMPDSLSFSEAASLPVSAGAAGHAFDKVEPSLDGAQVLILGASGGVGAYAVQLAVNAGATVTAVCSGAKSEFVASLGAHEVLDYRTTEVTNQARQFDVILDIGGNRPTRAMQRILSPDGTLVYVGGNGGAWFGGIGRAIMGSLKSAFSKQTLCMYFSEPDGADIAELVERVQRGELRAMVDRTYSLADSCAAFRSLMAGEACGKLVVEVE